MIRKSIQLNRSVLLNCVHYFLAQRIDREGKIDRKRLLGILGVSFHIPHEEKNKVIQELIDNKIILDYNKYWFKIKKEIKF